MGPLDRPQNAYNPSPISDDDEDSPVDPKFELTYPIKCQSQKAHRNFVNAFLDHKESPTDTGAQSALEKSIEQVRNLSVNFEDSFKKYGPM